MNALRRSLILALTLLPAAAGGREPDREEREAAERYQANYQALKRFIAEASQLQTAFLEKGDLAAFRQDGAKWEARVQAFLRSHLAPMYADEFAAARYRGPDVPTDHDSPARAAYQRIEARKERLRAYVTELRKPD